MKVARELDLLTIPAPTQFARPALEVLARLAGPAPCRDQSVIRAVQA